MAARPRRRDRLGRRLRRSPPASGVRARQGPRPDRRSSRVHHLRRRDPHRRVGAHVVRCRGARARDRRRRHARAAHAVRDEAVRRQVGRQGRHVRADVLVPRVPPRRERLVCRRRGAVDRVGHRACPASCSRTTQQRHMCRRPAGRSAKGEKPDNRNQHGKDGTRESGDHGRRRGHPAAAADLERAEADASGGQPADDGAHRRAAAQARLRRHRRDGRVPRAERSRPTSGTAPSSA